MVLHVKSPLPELVGQSFYGCFQSSLWRWSSDRAPAASSLPINGWLEIRELVWASLIIKCKTEVLKLPMVSTASLSRVTSPVSVCETRQDCWGDNFNPILWFWNLFDGMRGNNKCGWLLKHSMCCKFIQCLWETDWKGNQIRDFKCIVKIRKEASMWGSFRW